MSETKAERRRAAVDALVQERNRLDLEYFQRRERQREAEAEKTARLRALRLIKEAQEEGAKEPRR
jgi:hypothetical protein